ncbi:MAG: SGNH/GDSL hydrolase family protein, partial [Candidatus Nanopelagicales bacterium]
MWTRYVALGDSFTEGLMDEVGPDGRHVGWADRVAATMARTSPDLQYANLAVRGRLISQVAAEQVPVACDLKPDLVTFAAGVNDALRRSYDVHACATHLENSVSALRGTGADVVLFAFG